MVTLAFRVLSLQAELPPTFQPLPPGPLAAWPVGTGTAPYLEWRSCCSLPDTCARGLHKAESWWLYVKCTDGEGGAVTDARARRLRESCLHNSVGRAPSALEQGSSTGRYQERVVGAVTQPDPARRARRQQALSLRAGRRSSSECLKGQQEQMLFADLWGFRYWGNSVIDRLMRPALEPFSPGSNPGDATS